MSKSKHGTDATNGVTLWGYLSRENILRGNLGLPDPLPRNSIVAQTSYAPYDVQLGEKFMWGLLIDNPSIQIAFEAELTGIASFGFALPEISSGHHAVIVLTFPATPNELTKILSPLDVKNPDLSLRVAICHEDNWEKLKAEYL
ncbi:MAG: hypothetical protein AAFN11_16550 [Chloroflexota bacterium]